MCASIPNTQVQNHFRIYWNCWESGYKYPTCHHHHPHHRHPNHHHHHHHHHHHENKTWFNFPGNLPRSSVELVLFRKLHSQKIIYLHAVAEQIFWETSQYLVPLFGLRIAAVKNRLDARSGTPQFGSCFYPRLQNTHVGPKTLKGRFFAFSAMVIGLKKIQPKPLVPSHHSL